MPAPGPRAGDRSSLMPENTVTLYASESPGAVSHNSCPVVIGIPFGRGVCADPASLGARRTDGTAMPLQARALDRWPDGSVRWALADLQIDTRGAGPVAEIGPSLTVRPKDPALRVSVLDTQTIVETGRLRATVAGVASGIATLATPDIETELALVVTASDGSLAHTAITQAVVEVDGPVYAVIKLQGVITHGNDTLLACVLRLHFYAGHAVARVDVQVMNPRAATHPRGCWDLGDAGSVLVKGVGIVITRTAAAHGIVRCSPEPNAPLETCATPFLLHQDSSGGENWRSTNHLNRRRQIPRTFRGYRLTSGDAIREGLRSTPVVTTGEGAATLSLAMEQFWQNFPKAIAADERSLTLHLFPPHDADLHEIQGGEQKTHTFHVGLGTDTIASSPLEWVRCPPLLHVAPDYAAGTGAADYLTPNRAAHPGRLALVSAAIEGADTFAAKREVVDEYGWRNFGDVYGDHEAVRHRGPTPLISHYNNQYDPIEGFAIQFLQSGDRRWWEAMRELAWHVADVDVYHTDRDKAAYNRGLFWHTVHYVDADTATHRTYPSTFGHGGGPASEQNYVCGLRLAWLLTGEATFRETAIDLAAFPIRMDDGSRTVFRWLALGDTGLATSSGHPLYHGPGRGSGNSLAALIDGVRITGERQYLDKAEQLIRRVIHPADDIAARQLLDAERKWFYTMFLQALGRYLDYKVERGEYDRMFAWARESLLHYARWMAVHEYPYLEKPEVLEFPTETWAAQDIRKSDVFHHAERHAASDEERARFRERAAFFFESSIRTLTASPTRTLARPVIVLLSSGRLHDWFERHRGSLGPPRPPSAETFGAPTRFEPQKTRAIRRAKQLIALAALGGVLALIAVLRMWVL